MSETTTPGAPTGRPFAAETPHRGVSGTPLTSHDVAWAVRAAGLRHGYLGVSYHLRAWEELTRARGMRMDSRRVRLMHLRLCETTRRDAHHLPTGDCA